MANKKHNDVEINRQEGLTIFIFKKSLTFEKLMTISKKFYAGAPTRNVLFDISSSDLSSMTDEQISAASEFLKNNLHKRPPGAKTAFVALGFDDVGKLKSYRFWNIIRDTDLNSRIFHDHKSAYDWLNEDKI